MTRFSHIIERLAVLEPEVVFGALQAVISRAVHVPVPQDVPGHGGTDVDPESAIHHVVFLFDGLRMLQAGMGDDLQPDDAVPLDVVVFEFVLFDRRIFDDSRVADPVDDEVAKTRAHAVESTDMPAQTVVHQDERDDLPGRGAGTQGPVIHLDDLLLMDGAAEHGENIQVGRIELRRNLAGDVRLVRRDEVITEPVGQGSQRLLGGVFEQRGEGLSLPVALGSGVEDQVVGRQFAVQGDVTGSGGLLDTEPLDQIVTTDGAQESKPEINVGEPLPLGLTDVREPGRCHHIVQVGRGRIRHRLPWYSGGNARVNMSG